MAVQINSANIDAGMRFENRGRIRMMASVPSRDPALKIQRSKMRSQQLDAGKKLAWHAPVFKPKKSLICVDAIRIAIPFVNRSPPCAG